MNFNKALSVLMLVFALTVVAVNAKADPGLLGTDEGFSSPQTEWNASGDRTSHYPPYFHNEM